MTKKTITEGEENLFVRTFFAACSFVVFTVLIGFLNLLLYPVWFLFILLSTIQEKLYDLQDIIQKRMIIKQ